MKEDERKIFDDLMAKDANEIQKKHDEAAAKYTDKDEYEKLHLYGKGKE